MSARRRSTEASFSRYAPEDSEQRQRIRATAVGLFSRQGYEATTVKQLAHEIGMTPANLYNYYPGKEELLTDVLCWALARTVARTKNILAVDGSPAETIHALVQDLVLADLREPTAWFTASNGLAGLTGPNRQAVSRLMATIRGCWQGVIDAGLECGQFSVPDRRLATVTVISLASSVPGWFRPRGRLGARDVARLTADFALRILGHRGGASRSTVARRALINTEQLGPAPTIRRRGL